MWSAEARVLLRPAVSFRDLAQSDRERARLARRLLLLLFMLGCTVSALASGRFTLRLLVDGAISFAFIPAIELIALAVVLAMGRRRPLPYRNAASLFLAGNGIWLCWLIFLAVYGILTPTSNARYWWIVFDVTCFVPLAWSLVTDFHFFREVSGRSSAGAAIDVVIVRAIGWTTFLAYFFGIAIHGQILPVIERWMRL